MHSSSLWMNHPLLHLQWLTALYKRSDFLWGSSLPLKHVFSPHSNEFDLTRIIGFYTDQTLACCTQSTVSVKLCMNRVKVLFKANKIKMLVMTSVLLYYWTKTGFKKWTLVSKALERDCEEATLMEYDSILVPDNILVLTWKKHIF